MSSLVTETTRTLGLSGLIGRPHMVVGVIAIVVLLIGLMLREMARAELTGTRARRAETLRFATVPLTIVFVGVVAPRIVDLMT